MFTLANISKTQFHQNVFRYFCLKRVLSLLPAMERPILYGDAVSPPVRFVMMTASYLGIKLNFHEVNLFQGEHKLESYSKVNPLQKVPALAVGNEVIRDSHAIAIYLCNISNNKELYPDDAMTRAKVDEMLFFNAGALFPLDSAIFTAYFAGKWSANKEQVNQWNSQLDHLENILKKDMWLAGQKMMLCDLCCAATVTSLRLLLPPLERHNKVNEWIKKLQFLPFYTINSEGLHKLKYFVDKVKPSEV